MGKEHEIIDSLNICDFFSTKFNFLLQAKLCARVFASAGYKVYLFNEITPTPFVPFTVQQKKAAIGIMITASHNPKEDNGYKVFWNNGPQIKPPHDKLILKSINEHLEPMDDQIFNEDISEFNDSIFDPTEEIGSLYFRYYMYTKSAYISYNI